MKIDYDFLKNSIFQRFLDSESSQIFFSADLWLPLTGVPENRGIAEKLAFHWSLLCDRGMVAMVWPDKHGNEYDPKIAIRQETLGGSNYNFVIGNQPVRLTHAGQEFAQNLSATKKEKLEKIGPWGIEVISTTLKAVAVSTITNIISGS